jgi:BetR domain-containing protein
MEPTDLQQVFFKHIKSILPGHISLVDDVAELLNISNDSAYRRIRGEKPISLEEIKKLCTNYHISLDQIINIDSDSTVFFGKNLDGDNFDCEKYLDYLLLNLKKIAGSKEKMFYYEAKDLPLFYYFQFQELAEFKLFFWMKTALVCSGYNKVHFEQNELKEMLQKKSIEIIKAYNRIPSTEIWSIDSLNATIRQIEYYTYTGVFKKKETIELLYDQLAQVLEHTKEQADSGEKFLMGQKPQGDLNNFHLYYNEWFLGNNSVLIEADGMQTVYINHAVLNQLITQDKDFCGFTKRTINNILKKSLLISSVGEKERNRFFNTLMTKIATSKKDMLS